MQALIVYQGRDNTEDLVLFADGVPVALAGVTRVTLTVGAVTVDSQAAPTAITWPQAATWEGVAVDAIRFKLGGAGLAAGTHADCRLVVFDSAHPGGLVWTEALTVKVKA